MCRINQLPQLAWGWTEGGQSGVESRDELLFAGDEPSAGPAAQVVRTGAEATW